jgi:hypothetical protein
MDGRAAVMKDHQFAVHKGLADQIRRRLGRKAGTIATREESANAREGQNLRATSYIVTYRTTDDPARRANLEATLRWLKLQPLAEVIVVEQDEAPRWETSSPSPPCAASLPTIPAHLTRAGAST